MMRTLWNAATALVTRWPRRVIAAAVLLSLGIAAGIPLLRFETSQDSLIGTDNPVAVDNRRYQDMFGGEMMFVLFTAEPGQTIDDLASPSNLAALTAFDDRLRASGKFHSVVSPVTALTFARNQVAVSQQMVDAARARATGAEREVIQSQFQANAARYVDAVAEGQRLGLANPLTLENPAYVRFLLYEDDEGRDIRPAMQDNFPNRTHALSIVRLRGNVEIAEMGDGADFVRDEVATLELDGFDATTTGPPVLLKDINDYLRGGMATLGALAVGVMVAVLFVVFRVRWRLLSLAVVALGGVWAFGIMGIAGIPLTLITISGLPILIGIGIDFSIQAHSRFEEELAHGDGHHVAARRLMTHLAPALAVAMVAAAAGFLSLQLSDVALIRDFGAMLAIGIAALFLVGVLLPPSVLVLRERRDSGSVQPPRLRNGALERGVRWLCFSGRGLLAPLALATVVVLAAGLAVEGRFTIQTDPEKWLPPEGETVRSLEALRDGTGSSTELALLVEADDVTATPVASWMATYAAEQVAAHDGKVLRGTSMAGLAREVTGIAPGQQEMELLLGVAPDDVRASLVSPDRSRAAIIFPIANLSLEERERILDHMSAALDERPPPEGVGVNRAGLAAVGVELMNGLEGNRGAITWTAIGGVGLWLLLSYRRLTTAVLPMLPVLFAVGLSSLVIYWSGVELSPITAVSAPLVIASCTEFSVLILARYVEERRRGLDPDEAVELGAVRIGRAFVASGLTTVGGFGVLAFSSFPVLSDFGIVVGLNVLVALFAALVLLPPLLMWADRNPRLTGFAPGAQLVSDAQPVAAPRSRSRSRATATPHGPPQGGSAPRG